MTPKQVLEAVAVAADPIKFRLLSYAVAHESFRSSEAATVAGEDRSNGTVRSVHAPGLVRVGLLTRHEEPKVWYQITPFGRTIHAAITAALAAAGAPRGDLDQVAVLMIIDRDAYDEMRPDVPNGDSLEVALRSRLRAAPRERVFRVTRLE